MILYKNILCFKKKTNLKRNTHKMNNKIAKIYSEIQQIQEELTEKSYCIRNPASYYSSHEEQIRFNQEDRLNYIKLEKNLKELQTKIKH